MVKKFQAACFKSSLVLKLWYFNRVCPLLQLHLGTLSLPLRSSMLRGRTSAWDPRRFPPVLELLLVLKLFTDWVADSGWHDRWSAALCRLTDPNSIRGSSDFILFCQLSQLRIVINWEQSGFSPRQQAVLDKLINLAVKSVLTLNFFCVKILALLAQFLLLFCHHHHLSFGRQFFVIGCLGRNKIYMGLEGALITVAPQRVLVSFSSWACFIWVLGWSGLVDDLHEPVTDTHLMTLHQLRHIVWVGTLLQILVALAFSKKVFRMSLSKTCKPLSFSAIPIFFHSVDNVRWCSQRENMRDHRIQA